jgi:hypothetical protein
MTSTELAYPHLEVATPDQAQQFLDTVLIPAADVIEEGSYLESSTYEVRREQTHKTIIGPGGWTSIGFSAKRIEVDDDDDDILFNAWTYTGYDNYQFPFSETALAAADGYIQKVKSMISGFNIQDGSEEAEENDEAGSDIEHIDEVIEQHDFYVMSKRLKIIREHDYAYSRDGIIVWTESSEDFVIPETFDEFEKPSQLKGHIEEVEDGLYSSFNVLDLKIIAKILGSLGLLTASK